MNQHLQTILDFIQQSEHVSDEEKKALVKAAKTADKELEITSFKLERTEKVKHTTAILLEETIEELEQKRKAVEVQNRELEIESSLERVRTVAMSMNKADGLLNIAKTQFIELKQLGFTEIRNSLIGIFHDDKNYFTDYDYSDFSEGRITNIPYHKNPIVDKSLKQMKSATDAFTEFIVEGKDLGEWKAFRKQNGEYDDIRLNDAKSLYYYFYSISQGNVGISTFKKISDEQLNILKKFRNVFDLAYKRYTDITKAEAQAREAQVEAALEKIRSASLAMHHSNQLKTVAAVLFKKLMELGLSLSGACIFLFDRKTRDMQLWIATTTLSEPSEISIPFTSEISNNAIFKDLWNVIENGEQIFNRVYSGKEKNDYFRHVGNHNTFPQEVKDFHQEAKFWITSITGEKHAALGFDSWDEQLATTDDFQILKKFSKVFEQAYGRFLDLQKAEAQSRENQIQLALERARTQSMIMQHSTELDDTLRVFHEQVLQLGIRSAFSFLWLPDEEKDQHIFWAVWAENNSTIFKSKAINYPLDRNEPATKQCLIDWKSNEPVVSYHVPPGGVENYFAAWSELIAGVEQLKPEYFSDGLYYVEAFMKYECFGVMVERELKGEEKKILYRFAVEFERTYTRFLDLQKAEAQTREAQIETSLERIRARTMGMQKSNELQEIVALLYEECNRFEFRSLLINIKTRNEQDNGFNWWMSFNERNVLPQPYFIPDIDEPVLEEIKSLWHSEKPYGQIHMSGHIKAEHDRRLFSETELSDLPGNLKEMMLSYKSAFLSIANMKNGFIEVADKDFISEDQANILQRYAKVFEQAYTRFLDLQKAEAQARESKIQLALERVRARAMAMQKSDELASVSELLFTQVSDLGIKTWATGFNIWSDDNNSYEDWITSPRGGVIEPYIVNAAEFPAFVELSNARKRGEQFYVQYLDGEMLKQTYQELLKFGDKQQFEKLPGDEFQFPTKQYLHIVFGSQVSLMFITYEPVPEAHDIFKRFAKVFEQTYTRFLDLQKAEAQAREAQIEASLERVRSRSMGMQKSEELKEVIQVVYDQFVHLNIHVEHTGFIMDYKERDDMLIWLADKHAIPFRLTIPYFDSLHWNSFKEAKATGKDFFANHLDFEEKNKFYQDLFKLFPVSDEAKEYYFSCPGLAISTVLLDNVGLYIENFSGTPYTDEENNTLMRFGKVFQQTYTRFLDLQKAETQAREAKIEAALEKVRSRSLAMYETKELQEIVTIVFEKLRELGVALDAGGAIINIFIEHSKDVIQWIASPDLSSSASYYIPHFEHPIFTDLWNAREAGLDFFSKAYSYDEKNSMFKKFFEYTDYKYFPDDFKKWILQNENYSISGAWLKHSAILIPSHLGALPSEEQKEIVKRFAKVFEQAYIRFLDLQKAEAQSRESQIELSLERLRAKTMAMHNSADVGETAAAMVEELKKLGIETIRCGIGIMHEPGDMEVWTISTDENNKTDIIIGWLDMNMHPLLHGAFESWRNKAETYSYELKDDDLVSYYNAINNYPGYPIRYDTTSLPDHIHHNEFHFAEGTLFAFSLDTLSAETAKIFKRFAKVFGQTYRRFLDLQKAESQAREARIEASLERVRSKAMSMQKSDDLANAVAIVFEELDKLNLGMLRCGIGIINKGNYSVNVWASTKSDKDMPVQISGDESMDTHPLLRGAFNAWLKQEEYSYVLQGKDLTDYYETQVAVNFKLPDSQSLVTGNGDVQQYYFLATFQAGGLFAFRETAFSEEAKVVMKRFADVFNLTYTRYNDLQLAEAQTREAKIETAMEKVRSRAMAMQKPNELIEVAQLLRREMNLLGVEELETSSIYIHHEDTQKTECWYAIKDVQHPEKELVSDHINIDLEATAVGRQMLAFYYSHKKQISIPMQGNARKEWINYCADHSEVLVGFYGDHIPDRTYHLYKFSNGYMGAASPGNISTESWDLLQRATSVFSLAYTRFQDLQKAEAQTREAIRQASLDRVRAEIASMRTTADLEKITPLVWNELTILGIPFIRCGVFIMDDEEQQIHTFLSTPDGNAIAAFHLPYDTPGNFSAIIKQWHGKKIYTSRWNKDEFESLADTLVLQGAIATRELYLNTLPKDGIHLHFLPFMQGMLYVGNKVSLNDDDMQLVQSLADAFSTAYARYEDFNKLDAAKQQVDNTLKELRSAQQQLVQSEKMASLGELTAGIAHEIQNPLNFVNNFSEVNAELIEELKNERLKAKGERDEQLEIDILNDIAANEEKINHHGKRADAIVKGMLQHSRKDTGTKEPTDINKLTDEYLRLSYHGLRAKDKSFNADFKTDFDKGLSAAGAKINIVPQDIGRVLLNLYNNAFYATNEKKKQIGDGYEPRVTVSTKKLNDTIEIRVADNGNGIPQNIVDKIFQPFFTTKPTGQGTGLGLSLSYDIIKAHGGEIKAESKEGEGSEFIIQLVFDKR